LQPIGQRICPLTCPSRAPFLSRIHEKPRNHPLVPHPTETPTPRADPTGRSIAISAGTSKADDAVRTFAS
jgi:hypothetical protein